MEKRLHPAEFSCVTQCHWEPKYDREVLTRFERHGVTVTFDLGENVADQFLEELSELTRRWYRQVEGK